MTHLDALRKFLLEQVQASPDGFIVLTKERVEEIFKGVQEGNTLTDPKTMTAEEYLALAEKATPGQWTWWNVFECKCAFHPIGGIHTSQLGSSERTVIGPPHCDNGDLSISSESDAVFIAVSRNEAPRIIGELLEERAQLLEKLFAAEKTLREKSLKEQS